MRGPEVRRHKKGTYLHGERSCWAGSGPRVSVGGAVGGRCTLWFTLDTHTGSFYRGAGLVADAELKSHMKFFIEFDLSTTLISNKLIISTGRKGNPKFDFVLISHLPHR